MWHTLSVSSKILRCHQLLCAPILVCGRHWLGMPWCLWWRCCQEEMGQKSPEVCLFSRVQNACNFVGWLLPSIWKIHFIQYRLYPLTHKQQEKPRHCRYWCSGAKTSDHQYPQCWLNIDYTGPVSHKDMTHMRKNIRKYIVKKYTVV